VIAAIGIVAALGLSGCGDEPAEPGSAAVTTDTRVSVGELQAAYTDLNAVAKGSGGEPIPQTSLLSWLLLAPIAIPEAAKAGVAVSDGQASALLDRLHAQLDASKAAATAPPSPTPTDATATPTPTATTSPPVVPHTYAASTITAVRSYLSMQNVIQKLNERAAIEQWINQVYDQLDADKPQISPRYGTYTRPNPAAATSVDELLSVVGHVTPNWFTDSVTPSPDAGTEGSPAATPGEATPTSSP
jgi:hypothetical protein